MNESDLSALPDILNRLYSVVEDLQRLAPGRSFTPDGHLVGSIGEVVAAYAYGLELGAASTKAHDARATDGRLVQVKLTQGKSGVALSHPCDHLIVLRLDAISGFEEVYNGAGSPVWAEIVHKAEIGRQREVRLSRLRALAKTSADDRVAQLRAFPTLTRKAKAAVREANDIE
jgi:hypothetical protein